MEGKPGCKHFNERQREKSVKKDTWIEALPIVANLGNLRGQTNANSNSGGSGVDGWSTESDANNCEYKKT